MIPKKLNLNLKYNLNDYYHVVIQKSYVRDLYIYALQLRHKQTDIVVTRTLHNIGRNVECKKSPQLLLTDKAGGHTQTWEYAGNGYWLVGTKPQYNGHYWDIQIARVKFPMFGTKKYTSNTQIPRLSHLNQAGSGYGDDTVAYNGKYLKRVEATVSPDYQRLLIATIDTNNNGHFALYDLNEVNTKLDEIGHGNVRIDDLKCLGAFRINNFVNDDSTQGFPSVQGYGLDEKNNVYVSCQPSPTSNGVGAPRELIKIPWGNTNSDQWQCANLDNASILNMPGFYSEFEGIQVMDANKLYLTVSYHDSNASDLETDAHRIYEVTGFEEQ